MNEFTFVQPFLSFGALVLFMWGYMDIYRNTVKEAFEDKKDVRYHGFKLIFLGVIIIFLKFFLAYLK